MKRILVISFIALLVSGCTSGNSYNGKVTDLSSKYLDSGYSVNVFRSMTSLGDDDLSYGKAYVTMTFNVISNYTSTYDYDAEADYNITKKIVSNVHVVKSPKMGNPDELYGNYTLSGGTLLVGSNPKYEEVNPTPHSSGSYVSVAVKLNQIALYDSNTSPSALNGNQPTLSQVYNELGIDNDAVSMVLGFRVELVTVGGKTLYKDYEITVPPLTYDVTGTEFRMDFEIEDFSDMEPFFEKGA